MAVKIRFTRALGKPGRPRQAAAVQGALAKMDSFLRKAEPEAVEILVRALGSTGSTITYRELREAFLSGGLTQGQFEKWQREYSRIVTEALRPGWGQAAAEAAQEMKDRYPYFLYEPGKGAAAEWIRQYGAELVTNLAQDQMDALWAMVGHFSGYTATDPYSAARQMRACIGLTKPQAVSNLKYQEAVKAAYLKQHPAAKQATLGKIGAEAGARYAARQHRYRAQSIARTELAFGYNAGAYGATKDAQAQGYIGECRKKWLTAYDERVCPICSAMDEETADMDALFSNGKLLPPGHPQCRCAVDYVEIPATVTPPPQVDNGGGDGIIVSGARITDPDDPNGKKFAEKFYPEIRKRKTDSAKIAKNLGKAEEDIQKVKDYLFMNKSLYDEDLKEWRYFDADCAIAQSWQHLTDGKDIQSHDRTLIEHELYEMDLKTKNNSMTHDQAHTLAQEKYNYKKEAAEYYANLKKYKKG